MLLNQDDDLLADLSLAICSSFSYFVYSYSRSNAALNTYCQYKLTPSLFTKLIVLEPYLTRGGGGQIIITNLIGPISWSGSRCLKIVNPFVCHQSR